MALVLSTRRLTEHEGQLYLIDAALDEGGYKDPVAGDIIPFFGRYKEQPIYIELGGHALVKRGGREVGCWWVTRVDVEEEFKDVPVTRKRNRGED